MKVSAQQLIKMIEDRKIKNKTFFKDRWGRAYKYFTNEYDLMEIKNVVTNEEMQLINFIDNEFEVYL